MFTNKNLLCVRCFFKDIHSVQWLNWANYQGFSFFLAVKIILRKFQHCLINYSYHVVLIPPIYYSCILYQIYLPIIYLPISISYLSSYLSTYLSSMIYPSTIYLPFIIYLSNLLLFIYPLIYSSIYLSIK